MKNSKHKLKFAKEADLVCIFVSRLQGRTSPFGDVNFGLEFDYRSGRADVIARCESGEVLAFEAKLRDWKYASHQAYRNTCFAHRSYIIVPIDTARIAKKFNGEFIKRGVGICVLTEDGIEILLEARRADPLMPWLSERAGEYATRSEETKCSESLSSNLLPESGATQKAVNF